MEQDYDWPRLIHDEIEALFRFGIAATEDQLPAIRLLAVWGENTKDEAVCPLFRDNHGSLGSILSS